MGADLFGHPGSRALHEARAVRVGDGPGRSQGEGQRDKCDVKGHVMGSDEDADKGVFHRLMGLGKGAGTLVEEVASPA